MYKSLLSPYLLLYLTKYTSNHYQRNILIIFINTLITYAFIKQSTIALSAVFDECFPKLNKSSYTTNKHELGKGYSIISKLIVH